MAQRADRAKAVAPPWSVAVLAYVACTVINVACQYRGALPWSVASESILLYVLAFIGPCCACLMLSSWLHARADRRRRARTLQTAASTAEMQMETNAPPPPPPPPTASITPNASRANGRGETAESADDGGDDDSLSSVPEGAIKIPKVLVAPAFERWCAFKRQAIARCGGARSFALACEVPLDRSTVVHRAPHDGILVRVGRTFAQDGTVLRGEFAPGSLYTTSVDDDDIEDRLIEPGTDVCAIRTFRRHDMPPLHHPVLHGYGIMTMLAGITYEGEWLYGEMHGMVRVSMPDASQEGGRRVFVVHAIHGRSNGRVFWADNQAYGYSDHWPQRDFAMCTCANNVTPTSLFATYKAQTKEVEGESKAQQSRVRDVYETRLHPVPKQWRTSQYDACFFEWLKGYTFTQQTVEGSGQEQSLCDVSPARRRNAVRVVSWANGDYVEESWNRGVFDGVYELVISPSTDGDHDPMAHIDAMHDDPVSNPAAECADGAKGKERVTDAPVDKRALLADYGRAMPSDFTHGASLRNCVWTSFRHQPTDAVPYDGWVYYPSDTDSPQFAMMARYILSGRAHDGGRGYSRARQAAFAEAIEAAVLG